MTIRPEHRFLYPIDWVQLSRVIRFDRAQGRCEHCARPHGERVFRMRDGCWWDHRHRFWRDRRGRRARRPEGNVLVLGGWTRVVLACAHLNHDPTNNRSHNLAALCQRCHMIHDAPEHRRRRWINAHHRRALGDLFDGPYPWTRCRHNYSMVLESWRAPSIDRALEQTVPYGKSTEASSWHSV